MQVNNSYFKYRATARKHRGKITRLRGLVAEKHSEIFIHTRQQLLRGLNFNFKLLKNKYRNLQYENDSLDGIEKVDKPSATCICCTRPIFFI